MLKLFSQKKPVNQRAFLQIFISYSRRDKAFIEKLLGYLNSKEYKTWLDTKDILPSTQWLQILLNAIEQSSVFLMVISENSLCSEICLIELKHASELGKKIIPVVIGDITGMEIPEVLQSIQWVTWNNDDSLANNLERVNTAILIDLDWHILHTSIGMQTDFWKRNNETNDILLRGNMLLNAEAWIDDSFKDTGKLITNDQRRFILQSRKVIARENLLPILNGFILSVVFVFFLNKTGDILKTIDTPQGILSLELAMTAEKANHIINSWQSSGIIDAAYSSIVVDFIFIYTYLLFFIYSLKYFIAYFKRRKKLLSKIASLLLLIVLLVAIFDIVENIFLLLALDGKHFSIIIYLAVFSILKFIFMCLCNLYLVVALIYSFLFKRKIEAIETTN